MNTAMILRLVRKDWMFQRTPILAAFAAGALALIALATGGEGSFYAGAVLLITVVISLGIYLVIVTVQQERTDKTLLFIMSLPVSVQEYTAAKLVANMLMFLVPWTALGVGVVVVTLTRSGVPDGLLPFYILTLLELLAGYVLVLAVALVSESMGWTFGAIMFCNLFLQGFLYVVSHDADIAASMALNNIVWHRQSVLLLIAELALIVIIVVVAWRLQARKTDFL